MSLRRLGNLILLIAMAVCSTGRAHTTTIALTGDPAAEIPSADWDSVDLGTLNNSGQVAFTGKLKHEINNITANNDTGVWLYSGSHTSLLAQTGSANVPAISGANYTFFDQVALDDSGQVAVVGELEIGLAGVTTDNRQGMWRYTNTSNELLARTGSGDVPGVAGANFNELANAAGPNVFTQASDGLVAISAALKVGVGGVTSGNDKGIWSYSSSSANLLAREGVTGVPDISGASFQELALPTINSNDQLAFIASLEIGSGVSSGNSTGIWRYTGSVGELLARTGSGNVPGLVGANFSGFDSPLINDSGLVALQAELSTGEKGIWLYSDSTESLLTQTGIANVPDVLPAHFEDLSLASINDLGQVLVSAELEVGLGGVSASDNQGLWLLNGGQGLIARTGSGGVPSIAGANFASFAARALNKQGQVAFAAALQAGVGGVDSTNDGGIWIVDPNGGAVLVAREGEQLAGRTIASLDFLGDSISQADAFNDSGQLAFQATFTDGASGLFLYKPLRADFNTNGFVGSADLSQWQTAYSTTSGADADSDNDSDGADFLIWQQEFGSGTPPLSAITIVPEPSSGLLLLSGLSCLNGLAAGRRK